MALLDLSNLGRWDFDASKKTQVTNQISNSYQTTTSSVYSPTINRTFDIQYNIASGSNSSVSTKKEQSTNQTPSLNTSIIPQVLQIPTSSQGLTTEKTDGSNSSIMDYLVLGGIVLGAVILVPKVLDKPASTIRATRGKK